MKLDRENLRAALAEGNIEASDENIIKLRNSLTSAGHKYRAAIAERTIQKEAMRRVGKRLADLHEALATGIQIIEADRQGCGEVENTLTAMDANIKTKIDELVRFNQAVKDAAFFVGHKSRGKETAETSLYFELFDRYHEFTGRLGNALKGPLYPFEKACVALIDENIDFPNPNNFRVKLIAAKERRKPAGIADATDRDPL